MYIYHAYRILQSYRIFSCIGTSRLWCAVYILDHWTSACVHVCVCVFCLCYVCKGKLHNYHSSITNVHVYTLNCNGHVCLHLHVLLWTFWPARVWSYPYYEGEMRNIVAQVLSCYCCNRKLMAFEVVVRGGSNYMLSWLTCVCVFSCILCIFFINIIYSHNSYCYCVTSKDTL